MKISACLLLVLFVLSVDAPAQNVELSGGWAHISGEGGLDGYNVGVEAWFTKKASMAFDYDRAWDTSHLGAFALTSAGDIVTKSRMQNFLAGPRFFFPGVIKSKQKHIALLTPFAEGQFGVSYLRSTLRDRTRNISQFASDNAFSWMIGGGVDYRFAPHWLGRVKADLLRTHLVDSGQSRLRFSLAVVYTWKER
jgi:hypothetical protein